MNKVIPIRYEPVVETDYCFIEWKLSNVCNYKCSYCPDEWKNGSKEWLGLSTYIKGIEQIYKQCGAMNKRPYINFTGGEPTIHPEFIDLLRHSRQLNNYLSLMSNGTADIEFWRTVAKEDLLDKLFLSIHLEHQPNIKHIIDIIKLFEHKPVKVVVHILVPDTVVDIAYSIHNRLLSETSVTSMLKPLFSSSKQTYTEEQTILLRNNKIAYSDTNKPATPLMETRMNIVYDDGTVSNVNSYYAIATERNKFKDWECSIGMSRLVIEQDAIYKGTCQTDGIVGYITDNKQWFSQSSTICKLNSCECGGDMTATKVKIIQ